MSAIVYTYIDDERAEWAREAHGLPAFATEPWSPMEFSAYMRDVEHSIDDHGRITLPNPFGDPQPVLQAHVRPAFALLLLGVWHGAFDLQLEDQADENGKTAGRYKLEGQDGTIEREFDDLEQAVLDFMEEHGTEPFEEDQADLIRLTLERATQQ